MTLEQSKQILRCYMYPAWQGEQKPYKPWAWAMITDKNGREVGFIIHYRNKHRFLWRMLNYKAPDGQPEAEIRNQQIDLIRLCKMMIPYKVLSNTTTLLYRSVDISNNIHKGCFWKNLTFWFLYFLSFSALFMKFLGKIIMFPANLGRPGCFAYNYFPQLSLLTEIFMTNY